MSISAGSVSPVSTEASAAMSAHAMASSVIDKLAALPQALPATPANRCEEPSAPNTPPTALHEAAAAASESATSASGPSQASSSSRSSSMALPFAADEGCSVFFARVPPTKQEEEILQVFQQYGPVHSVNLYRRWAASKCSKGCGIVVFEGLASANAAISALHNKFLWPDAAATMVVEKVDRARLQRDSAGKKHTGNRFHRVHRATGFGSDAHTPASFNGGMGMPACSIAASPAGPNYLPTPDQQQQGRWSQQGVFWLPGQQQWQQQQVKKSMDKHSGYATEGSGAETPLVWGGQGYTAPYPYYYGPTGMPYMMYSPGYCYPMTYSNSMHTQYAWMPYVPPGGPYAVPASCPFSAAAAGAIPPAAAATPAAGGSDVADHRINQTSSNKPAGDTAGRQAHVAADGGGSGVKKLSAADAKQQQLQEQQGSGRHPRPLDIGDQVLNAKQLTTCIKNSATAEAIQHLVQRHLKNMNHIHVSAALGRLAVIAAGNYSQQHQKPQHQQLVTQLMDHLVKGQLAYAKPFELCNSLSAAAKLGGRVPSVQVQQMLDAFVGRLGLSKPNEVCTMISAAARMGHRVPEEQFRLLLAVAVGNLQDCTARKVQELLRVVKDMGYVVEDEQMQQLRAAADEGNCSAVVANSMSHMTAANSS